VRLKNSLSLLIPLVVFVLSGCGLIRSGNRMDVDLAVDKKEENIQVEFVAITPQLILEQEKAHPAATIPPELLTNEPKMYRIGAGDVLLITVWDHPELTIPSGTQQQILSNGRVVHPNGELFYPHVGTVMALGMTLLELSQKLTADLHKYIESPQVDVSVLAFESQKVLMSGALRSTAPIRITTSPISLVEALGLAGVDTEEADLSRVILTRAGRQYVLNVYELTRDSTDINYLYLQDQDRIHVSYNDYKKIFLMGEVKTPMAMSYTQHSVSLSNALSTAGGLDQLTSNGNAVYVIRGMTDMEKQPAKIFRLQTEQATGFILASRFMLEPQDVVYVGSTKITQWNRVITSLLPTATLFQTTAEGILDVKAIDNAFGNSNNN
jgi:polysaccharide export outer membrane protein